MTVVLGEVVRPSTRLWELGPIRGPRLPFHRTARPLGVLQAPTRTRCQHPFASRRCPPQSRMAPTTTVSHFVWCPLVGGGQSRPLYPQIGRTTQPLFPWCDADHRHPPDKRLTMDQAMPRECSRQSLPARRHRRQKVLERARLATVGFGIRWLADPERFPRIIGSGVTVDRKGIVLTARHVVLDLEAMLLKETRLGNRVEGVVIIMGSAQSNLLMASDGQEVRQCSIAYTATQIAASQINRQHDIAAVQPGSCKAA